MIDQTFEVRKKGATLSSLHPMNIRLSVLNKKEGGGGALFSFLSSNVWLKDYCTIQLRLFKSELEIFL